MNHCSYEEWLINQFHDIKRSPKIFLDEYLIYLFKFYYYTNLTLMKPTQDCDYSLTRCATQFQIFWVPREYFVEHKFEHFFVRLYKQISSFMVNIAYN